MGAFYFLRLGPDLLSIILSTPNHFVATGPGRIMDNRQQYNMREYECWVLWVVTFSLSLTRLMR